MSDPVFDLPRGVAACATAAVGLVGALLATRLVQTALPQQAEQA